MPKNYILNAETGHFNITGQEVKLVHTAVVETIQMNWWLIAFYAVTNLLAIYFGAFVITLPWLNAAVSSAVFIGSTAIGYVMMCKVVTITRNQK